MSEPAALINAGIVIDDPATQWKIAMGKLKDIQTVARYGDDDQLTKQINEAKRAFEQYRRLEGK